MVPDQPFILVKRKKNPERAKKDSRLLFFCLTPAKSVIGACQRAADSKKQEKSRRAHRPKLPALANLKPPSGDVPKQRQTRARGTAYWAKRMGRVGLGGSRLRCAQRAANFSSRGSSSASMCGLQPASHNSALFRLIGAVGSQGRRSAAEPDTAANRFDLSKLLVALVPFFTISIRMELAPGPAAFPGGGVSTVAIAKAASAHLRLAALEFLIVAVAVGVEPASGSAALLGGGVSTPASAKAACADFRLGALESFVAVAVGEEPAVGVLAFATSGILTSTLT